VAREPGRDPQRCDADESREEPIGLAASDPRSEDPEQWRGQNLLGKILTRLRDELLAA
jgi:predicted NAD-dependent protein-ADP-ribosyltransferase YbiA (DUF1768 family)